MYRKNILTQEDIQMIINLYNAGKTAEEIAQVTGRTKHAIHQRIYLLKKSGQITDEPNNLPPSRKLRPTGIVHPVEQEKEPVKKEMTPRDMIKALYDLGYRIEDNHLVCYVKQTVKLQDIIGV